MNKDVKKTSLTKKPAKPHAEGSTPNNIATSQLGDSTTTPEGFGHGQHGDSEGTKKKAA